MRGGLQGKAGPQPLRKKSVVSPQMGCLSQGGYSGFNLTEGIWGVQKLGIGIFFFEGGGIHIGSWGFFGFCFKSPRYF